jgi:hypothetical protein
MITEIKIPTTPSFSGSKHPFLPLFWAYFTHHTLYSLCVWCGVVVSWCGAVSCGAVRCYRWVSVWVLTLREGEGVGE